MDTNMTQKKNGIRGRLRKPIIPISTMGIESLPLRVTVHKKTEKEIVLQINASVALKIFEKLQNAGSDQSFFIEFLYESMIKYCRAFGYTIDCLTAQANKLEATVYVVESK